MITTLSGCIREVHTVQKPYYPSLDIEHCGKPTLTVEDDLIYFNNENFKKLQCIMTEFYMLNKILKSLQDIDK